MAFLLKPSGFVVLGLGLVFGLVLGNVFCLWPFGVLASRVGWWRCCCLSAFTFRYVALWAFGPLTLSFLVAKEIAGK